MNSPAQRTRVMIVDDEPGMLRAAERVLASTHEVLACPLPSAALAACAAFNPDLVITDIRMPEMDGFVLADELRRRLPQVDVIFMTGSHSEPDAHLVRAIRSGAFYFIEKPFDRVVLETLVGRCLELRRLRQSERAHARHLELELAEARLFQRTMLAPANASLAGWTICAECRPCNELGGDLYDYTLTPGGSLAFIIADVRGHGASAAMLTAIVKAAFQSGGGPEHDPLRVIGALVGMIAPFGDDRFVTAFCARIAPGGRTLEYVNAGHPAAIVLAPGAAPTQLASTGPLVSSAFPPGSWEAARATLPEQAVLLVYTDGVSDVLRAAGSSVEASVLGAAAAPSVAGALMTSAATALAGRPAPDDMSALALGRAP